MKAMLTKALVALGVVASANAASACPGHDAATAAAAEGSVTALVAAALDRPEEAEAARAAIADASPAGSAGVDVAEERGGAILSPAFDPSVQII